MTSENACTKIPEKRKHLLLFKIAERFQENFGSQALFHQTLYAAQRRIYTPVEHPRRNFFAFSRWLFSPNSSILVFECVLITLLLQACKLLFRVFTISAFLENSQNFFEELFYRTFLDGFPTLTKVYLKHCQTSMMKLFMKIHWLADTSKSRIKVRRPDKISTNPL